MGPILDCPLTGATYSLSLLDDVAELVALRAPRQVSTGAEAANRMTLC